MESKTNEKTNFTFFFFDDIWKWITKLLICARTSIEFSNWKLFHNFRNWKGWFSKIIYRVSSYECIRNAQDRLATKLELVITNRKKQLIKHKVQNQILFGSSWYLTKTLRNSKRCIFIPSLSTFSVDWIEMYIGVRSI